MERAFDITVIQQLQDLMGDDFALLVETFINDSSKRLTTINEAIAVNDAELVRTTAHGLKGSALNLSATRLSEYASKLEAMGKLGDLSGASAASAELVCEFERVCAELKVI